MKNSRFDAAVVSTLKNLYCEMLNPGSPQQTTKLSGNETDAVDDAVKTVNQKDPSAPASPEQKRIADLEQRRKGQLQQVGRTAVQKLQKSVSQPINS